MKSKLIMSVVIALTLVVTLVGNAGVARAEAACDPAFVSKVGNVITVKPTGVADTANIQCAFDLAIATGPSIDFRLFAGTYYTAQIVANDFNGKFGGAGMDKTLITNIPNVYVTPVDFYLNPPSADNPWAALFAFVNGDFAISDLAIKITGENPTMPWTVFGIDPPLREFALGIVILGSEAHVRVDRILMEGEPKASSLYGYNLGNGIFFEGFLGELPWPPISGSFEVYNSVFKRMASATPVTNLKDATVILSFNHYEELMYDASDSADLVNSSITFSHNQVDNALFGYLAASSFGPNVGSTILIKNNLFRTTYGPFIDAIFGEGNECLIMGNDVQNVTDIGIYLGPYTTGCTVVGGSPKTNVLDLGTGNILVGVNNRGRGIGPVMPRFLRP